MNILITGANLKAVHIAEALMHEHQVFSVRPAEGDTHAHFEHLDIHSVLGQPTSPETLRRADVHQADVFIACDDVDEQNIVSCLAAQRLGAKRTVCLLSRRGFFDIEDTEQDLADSLGIDEVIRPAEQLAQSIIQIITVPGALDVREFSDRRVTLLRYAVEEDAPVTRGPLKSVILPRGVVLVMIKRGEEVIVPHGATRLQAGDNVFAMGRRGAVQALALALRKQGNKEKHRVAIIGAGSVGESIARRLETMDWAVKLIELDEERCEQVAGRLKGIVLQGDGADLDLLEQERIGEMPVVVCVTSNDEKNLLVSLLAKSLGVPRIVTRAVRHSSERIFEKVGVDVVLSAHGAAIRSVIDLIGAAQSEIRAEIDHGAACVIELTLPLDFKPRPLFKLNPPKYTVVGSVTRGRKVIIPRGTDELKPGDQLLVFCLTDNEQETHDFFMKSSKL